MLCIYEHWSSGSYVYITLPLFLSLSVAHFVYLCMCVCVLVLKSSPKNTYKSHFGVWLCVWHYQFQNIRIRKQLYLLNLLFYLLNPILARVSIHLLSFFFIRFLFFSSSLSFSNSLHCARSLPYLVTKWTMQSSVGGSAKNIDTFFFPFLSLFSTNFIIYYNTIRSKKHTLLR